MNDLHDKLKLDADLHEIFFETMSGDTLKNIAAVLSESGGRCPGPQEALWFADLAQETEKAADALSDDPVRQWALRTYAGVLRSLVVIWANQQGTVIGQLKRLVEAGQVFSVISGVADPSDFDNKDEGDDQ